MAYKQNVILGETYFAMFSIRVCLGTRTNIAVNIELIALIFLVLQDGDEWISEQFNSIA